MDKTLAAAGGGDVVSTADRPDLSHDAGQETWVLGSRVAEEIDPRLRADGKTGIAQVSRDVPRGGQHLVPPEWRRPVDDVRVPEAGRPGVLETAGKEAKSFLSKTVLSFGEWAAKRIVDLVAPGIGAAISACEQIVHLVKAGKALAAGSGEIGVPVAKFGDFEFKMDVHIGDDPKGRDLPVSAFIAPGEGDSLFDQIDIAPDSDHRYAVVITTDLSGLSGLPEPASKAGVIRSYTDQEILPGCVGVTVKKPSSFTCRTRRAVLALGCVSMTAGLAGVYLFGDHRSALKFAERRWQVNGAVILLAV